MQYLVFFGVSSYSNNENSLNFEETKPDIVIINEDKNEGITKGLITYLTNNANIKDIEDNEEARDDALFYRDVNYIIYIPKDFNEDFLNNKNPQLDIKTTGDYNASLTEMLLNRYLKVASIYVNNGYKGNELIEKIENTINKEVSVEVTSKIDNTNLSKASTYYNFLSYSMLAGCIYVICLILSSFKETNVNRRTIISSMNYKSFNRDLFLSNMLYAVILWLIYVIISFILVGKVMFTGFGVLYIINSFVFLICGIALAFLIGNIINNKDAINGIINVIGLGSSFLCGAFVPIEWLPDTVLKIAHILPSYWYIQTNELVANLEIVNLASLKEIFINMGMVVGFALLYVVLANVLQRGK